MILYEVDFINPLGPFQLNCCLNKQILIQQQINTQNFHGPIQSVCSISDDDFACERPQQLMRLKQSNKLNQKIYLPKIKAKQSTLSTPKHHFNSYSLSKISSQSLPQFQLPLFLNPRNPMPGKKPLKERLKEIYNRKKEMAHLHTIENDTSTRAVDQSVISNKFMNEIQRNLQHIKKVKERNRLEKVSQREKGGRYRNLNNQKQFSKEHITHRQKSLRIATEDSVFSKINEILQTSQSKTSLLAEERKNLSLNAYLKEKDMKKLRENRLSRKKIKTQTVEQHDDCRYIKDDKNYQEWRKLSIDSLRSEQAKYESTSYEAETERLQGIRQRNELSLKKYLQGRDYLQNLIKYSISKY